MRQLKLAAGQLPPVIRATVEIPNIGLKVLDTDGSHFLTIAPGSNLSAARTLTITTGDAARTVTISGDATISQDYSTSGSPQFTGLTVTGTATMSGAVNFDADACRLADTNASHYLILTPGSNLTANRVLTITTGDAAVTTDFTAATAGKFFRADGTNWAASTLVLPNAATANRIPYATGANTWGEAAGLTYDGTTLTASGLTVSGATMTFSNASGMTMSSSANDLNFGVPSTFGFAWKINSVNKMTLDSAGVLGVMGFGAHSFSAGGTGEQIVSVRNTTAGTGNLSRLRLGNDLGDNSGLIDFTSSTFTATGAQQQNSLNIRSLRAGGISVASEDASGAIRFYTGGTTERWRVETTGHLVALSDLVIRRSTSDGSDNGLIAIAGGGSNDIARGAYINVVGNEHATAPGRVQVNLGNVAGSDFIIDGPTFSVLDITGSDGFATFTSSKTGTGWSFDTSGASAILLPRMSTAERDTIGTNGQIIYNETTNKVQVYEGGAWVNVI